MTLKDALKLHRTSGVIRERCFGNAYIFIDVFIP